MLELSNTTAWTVGLYPGWNFQKEYQMTCVLKRGYSFDKDGNVKPLDSESKIIETDEYYSSPEDSSLKDVHEISPFKLGSETYLFGTAYPAENKIAMEVEFGIKFNDGKSWLKKLRVTGKRKWNKILLGYVMSKTDKMSATELKYENAYGGFNPDNNKECFTYNPIGKGFNKASGWRVLNLELPSIEIGPKYLKSPPQQVQPAGFAPLSINWQPRKNDLGDLHPTPEEQGGCPYSDKAKITLHNVAPLDQRFPMPFVGGETIYLKGFFEDLELSKLIKFSIPKIKLATSLIFDGKRSRLKPVFDTLIINTDLSEFYIIYRIAIPWSLLETKQAWVVINDLSESISSSDTLKSELA